MHSPLSNFTVGPMLHNTFQNYKRNISFMMTVIITQNYNTTSSIQIKDFLGEKSHTIFYHTTLKECRKIT